MKEKNTFKFYRQRLATNKLSLTDKTAAWWLLVCFAQNTFVAYHPPWSQTPESNNYKMVWLIPEAIIAIPKSSHAMEKFTTSINGTTLDMTQQQDIHWFAQLLAKMLKFWARFSILITWFYSAYSMTSFTPSISSLSTHESLSPLCSFQFQVSLNTLNSILKPEIPSFNTN